MGSVKTTLGSMASIPITPARLEIYVHVTSAPIPIPRARGYVGLGPESRIVLWPKTKAKLMGGFPQKPLSHNH